MFLVDINDMHILMVILMGFYGLKFNSYGQHKSFVEHILVRTSPVALQVTTCLTVNYINRNSLSNQSAKTERHIKDKYRKSNSNRDVLLLNLSCDLSTRRAGVFF